MRSVENTYKRSPTFGGTRYVTETDPANQSVNESLKDSKFLGDLLIPN